MRVDVEMVPEGREDCRECFGAGFVIDDPGGPLKDMPPMLPARGCPKCNPRRLRDGRDGGPPRAARGADDGPERAGRRDMTAPGSKET